MGSRPRVLPRLSYSKFLERQNEEHRVAIPAVPALSIAAPFPPVTPLAMYAPGERVAAYHVSPGGGARERPRSASGPRLGDVSPVRPVLRGERHSMIRLIEVLGRTGRLISIFG